MSPNWAISVPNGEYNSHIWVSLSGIGYLRSQGNSALLIIQSQNRDIGALLILKTNAPDIARFRPP